MRKKFWMLLICGFVFAAPVPWVVTVHAESLLNSDFDDRYSQYYPSGSSAPKNWLSIDPGDVLTSQPSTYNNYKARLEVGTSNISSGPKGIKTNIWSSPKFTAGQTYTISVKVYIEKFNSMPTKNLTLQIVYLGGETPALKLDHDVNSGPLSEHTWHTFSKTWTAQHTINTAIEQSNYVFKVFFTLNLNELPVSPDPFVWYFDNFSIN